MADNRMHVPNQRGQMLRSPPGRERNRRRRRRRTHSREMSPGRVEVRRRQEDMNRYANYVREPEDPRPPRDRRSPNGSARTAHDQYRRGDNLPRDRVRDQPPIHDVAPVRLPPAVAVVHMAPVPAPQVAAPAAPPQPAPVPVDPRPPNRHIARARSPIGCPPVRIDSHGGNHPINGVRNAVGLLPYPSHPRFLHNIPSRPVHPDIRGAGDRMIMRVYQEWREIASLRFPNAVFFYNAMTRECTWQKPAGLAAYDNEVNRQVNEMNVQGLLSEDETRPPLPRRGQAPRNRLPHNHEVLAEEEMAGRPVNPPAHLQHPRAPAQEAIAVFNRVARAQAAVPARQVRWRDEVENNPRPANLIDVFQQAPPAPVAPQAAPGNEVIPVVNPVQ